MLAAVLILPVFAVLAIDRWVESSTEAFIFNNVDEAPPAQAAIVLGARVYPNGHPSPVLADRLLTGVALYRAGKVRKLLLSGDHGQLEYDEVNAMRDYVRSLGVPARDIFMDHAGFSTYETMFRARDVFGLRDAVVVTQGFHLPRAVFIARRLGLDAAGVTADRRRYVGEEYLRYRDALARAKDVIQLYVLKSRPTFLGPAIPITGDGRATEDQPDGQRDDPRRAEIELLAQYGWTPEHRINSYPVRLPENLQHQAGTFPIKLYWAYNNELNGDIGLDLTPHLGREATLSIYRLAEPLPDFLRPRTEARAVVLSRDGEVIGAWIDAGRHSSFACSLKRRGFEDITGLTWDDWVAGFIDRDDPLEQELARLGPEEIIRTYWQAVNDGDHRRAYATLSRRTLAQWLSTNMDNNFHANRDFADAYAGEGLDNYLAAEVLGIREYTPAEPPGESLAGARSYEVKVDIEVKKTVSEGSGVATRFTTVKPEAGLGWRIVGMGTGP